MVATELITGMEDIINYLRELENKNKLLVEENNKLKHKVKQDISVCMEAKEDIEKVFEENKKLKEENENLCDEEGAKDMWDLVDKQDYDIAVDRYEKAETIIETIVNETGKWFMDGNSACPRWGWKIAGFMEWSEQDPVKMVNKLRTEYDEYYQKQKDYEQIIENLGDMIANIDQNACDVFNEQTKSYDVFHGICPERDIEGGEIDYDDLDDWNEACGLQHTSTEYRVNCCGGCPEWFDFVIKSDGCFIHNKDGYEKVKTFISASDGDYIKALRDQDDFELNSGEIDLLEMVKESYPEIISD